MADTVGHRRAKEYDRKYDALRCIGVHVRAKVAPMQRSEEPDAPSQRSAKLDYSVPEAAERLDVSVRYTWYLVARKELPSFKRHGRRLIAGADLGAYEERLRQKELQERAAADA